MIQLEEDHSFDCPHCAETNTIRVDLTGGKKQKLVYDCETCCRPILIRFESGPEGILDFTAEKE